MFDDDFLKRKTDLPERLFNGDSYLYFQINLEIARRSYPVIMESLHEMKRLLGCRICLCPIGTALGHEDDVALAYIHEHMNDDDVLFVPRPTIWDVISLVRHSCLYVGTSLHGMITAMSYGIPFVGVEVKKVRTYIETWVDGDVDHRFCKIDNMVETARKAIGLTYDCSRQKESAKESILRMREIVQKA